MRQPRLLSTLLILCLVWPATAPADGLGELQDSIRNRRLNLTPRTPNTNTPPAVPPTALPPDSVGSGDFAEGWARIFQGLSDALRQLVEGLNRITAGTPPTVPLPPGDTPGDGILVTDPPIDETTAIPDPPTVSVDPPTTTTTDSGPSGDDALRLSTQARQQMARVLQYAKTHHRGASGGFCFNAVWGYLTTCGYGKLKAWGDLPEMKSGEARNFAEFMNASTANQARAGLRRLDRALNPPISSPHDRRIPAGAVIVVAAGSTGTANPTAGDIVLKSDDGRFINDGPNMDYGTPSSWRGRLLGVYVPE